MEFAPYADISIIAMLIALYNVWGSRESWLENRFCSKTSTLSLVQLYWRRAYQ